MDTPYLFLIFCSVSFFFLFVYFFLRERMLVKKYGSIVNMDIELKKRERLVKDLEARYISLLMRDARKHASEHGEYPDPQVRYAHIDPRAVITKDA